MHTPPLLTSLILLSVLSSVSASGWFIQEFYNITTDSTCSKQYHRATAHALDVCIQRGHTSTKYTRDGNGDTLFSICNNDPKCANCTTHTLKTNTCGTNSQITELESMYIADTFPQHFLPQYYVLSVSFPFEAIECMGQAEVLHITSQIECFEFCDGNLQQFCSEFPKHIIDSNPSDSPISTPPPLPPTVRAPWFVAEYYLKDDCSQFAFAHLFELDTCMSPPHSPISSVFRLATDGNAHEYQCVDSVCGYCKDMGVPPGYKGCAREDAHDLPARLNPTISFPTNHPYLTQPHVSRSLASKREDNYTWFYLNSYVSNVFPESISVDNAVVVYYKGYVEDGKCGGEVDHIIITPKFSGCEEICVYGLQFYCEVPNFLSASGAPVSGGGKSKSHAGKTVAVVFVVLLVIAGVGVGGFFAYKHKQTISKKYYSLLNQQQDADDNDEI